MGRARALPLLLMAVAILAGCTSAGENPHALAPKLVLYANGEGHIEAYVHSGVGERTYDSLVLRLNNQTLASRTQAYALVETLPDTGGYLSVQAAASSNSYTWNALVLPGPAPGSATVITFDHGAETNRETVTLPWSKLIEGTASE